MADQSREKGQPQSSDQDAPLVQRTSPLGERLKKLIASHGPITIEDYMTDALFHPNDGYYTSQLPIGARGDFTTAPEVSQIFGELIGLWLVQAWTDIGEPDYFSLIELGPGRGVMMQDILRAASIRPKFLKAANVQLVETSGRLRHEQQKRLRDAPAKATWKDSFEETDEGPILLVANEFLDCLPIRQFRLTEDGWRERMVNINQELDELVFTDAYAPPIDMEDPPPNCALGDIFETRAPGNAIVEEISQRLADFPGRALFIDYGYTEDAAGDTLQAAKKHERWQPLDAPGLADITAHVNF
ncbi:MAG: SAM-dependent methyltransferase, partial [Pseudomonadota bacterium]